VPVRVPLGSTLSTSVSSPSHGLCAQHWPMDNTDSLQTIQRWYLERMLSDRSGLQSSDGELRGDGIQSVQKVLIMDEETVRLVSTAVSQHEILRFGVYLTERIEQGGGMANLHDQNKPSSFQRDAAIFSAMSAVYFVRPTKENIRRIRLELKEPRFRNYCVYFSNVVPDLRLQDLAEGDGKELVTKVKEVFADYISLDAYHFSVPLGIDSRYCTSLAPPNLNFGASSDLVDRCTDTIAAVMLSLRSNFQIRYSKNSEMAQRLAKSLHQLTVVDQQELFDFGSRDRNSVVLLLDRNHDPVTPLLSQWTYQAMIHEVLGTKDNIVSLDESRAYVISSLQDEFFRKNMFLNFGDVGMAVKDLVDKLSVDHKVVRGLETIEDIAAFVEDLPQATQQQGLTAKHVAIMSCLSKIVEERSLMKVSGVEQDVCCQTSNPTAHYQAVTSILEDPVIRVRDKARLVLLYALRYGGDAPKEVASICLAMERLDGAETGLLNAIRYMRKRGTSGSSLDLFSDKTLSSRFASLAKQHLHGVENVYTQHQPAFAGVIERISRGRLAAEDYPSVDGRQEGHQRSAKVIIAFIIGGTTYEEAKVVAEMNEKTSDSPTRIYLGGTSVTSSDTYLDALGLLSERVLQ
jgi:vacuolar protein sorting-associated protein 45